MQLSAQYKAWYTRKCVLLSNAFATLCGWHSKRLPCSHITVTVFAVVLDGSESMMFPSISG